MPTNAEQKQQGATVRDSRDHENAEPPRIKTHLRINTGAKSPVEKFPQPRINFSGKSGSSPDNVRRQYLKQLGYTPLHFLKEDSPSCRTRKSFYDPNMTPTAEGGGNFYNPAMTPTTEERTIITTTQKKYGATGEAKQNAIVKSKLSDVPEDTVNASTHIHCQEQDTCKSAIFLKVHNIVLTCLFWGTSARSFDNPERHVPSWRGCSFALMKICRTTVLGKGTCVAYLIAIGDIIVPIVKEISRGTSYELLATRPILVAFVAIFCMCPISLVDTVTELRSS
eukprot:jgi/Bigna1/75576/fgenesh1_pg.35_\